ncbi:MAG: sulfotransferase family protein [Lysobacterales bacterium]|nr:MAG: sulfotransferase family protein [Xanthomonadales bacterium]
MTLTETNDTVTRFSRAARRAVENRDWATVIACASEIQRLDPDNAEGWFLGGLAVKVEKKPLKAIAAFEKTLQLDPRRYDAAVELANQYSIARRNADAAAMLASYEAALSNSPIYLDLAATVYTEIGLSERAWPLYVKANEVQPGVDLFQSNLAACAVYLGKIEEAREIYLQLLERFPDHRRNHYQLSRLQKARDFGHVERMKEILARGDAPPEHNIPLYFAIAKELEDLEQWDESFEYYRKAGDAVTKVANYDVAKDIALIDKVIEVCDADWLADRAGDTQQDDSGKTPIFVVGLPRTGTTLTERILSSHSQVTSLGETLFLQMVLRRESGVASLDNMNSEMIEALANKDMGTIAKGYIDAVRYRLGPAPLFIEKLPFNFLYLGFIARAWPQARIVHLVRNPMDACFSMYKQVFTWAYKFSYSLDSLGRYYVAHDRLARHWRALLGERLVEVEYENLVADQEGQTRRLLERLGLPFEEACLQFDRNQAPSATASSVQVREKVHSGSVRRWKRFETQLQPLRDYLESAGIRIE